MLSLNKWIDWAEERDLPVNVQIKITRILQPFILKIQILKENLDTVTYSME